MDGEEASKAPSLLLYSAAALLALIAIAYPVWRGVISPKPEVDFRSFWLAGYLWGHGGDPYAPTFTEFGKRLLPDGNSVAVWFYPPNWWIFCRAFALFDLPTALTLWRISLTLILLGATGAVATLLTRGLPVAQRAFLAALACAFATTIEPSGYVLTAGQVSPILVYLSLALIICAQLTSSTILLVMGLVLACLKPQVGLLLLLAYALSPRHRPAVIWAIAISALLSLPQLILFGPVTTAREVLANLASYNSFIGNTPLSMTSPSHLAARLGLLLPFWVCFAFATATTVAAGVMLRRDAVTLRPIAVLLAGIAAVLPLHSYDMTMLLLVTMAAMHLRTSRAMWIVSVISLCLILRPERIERLINIPGEPNQSPGTMLVSIVALFLFAVVVYCICGPLRSARRGPGSRVVTAT